MNKKIDDTLACLFCFLEGGLVLTFLKRMGIHLLMRRGNALFQVLLALSLYLCVMSASAERERSSSVVPTPTPPTPNSTGPWEKQRNHNSDGSLRSVSPIMVPFELSSLDKDHETPPVDEKTASEMACFLSDEKSSQKPLAHESNTCPAHMAMLKGMTNKEPVDLYFDQDMILDLAKASQYVYMITNSSPNHKGNEKLVYKENKVDKPSLVEGRNKKIPSGYQVVDSRIYKKSDLHVGAFYDPAENILMISYKGSSELKDFMKILDVLVSNFISTQKYVDLLNDAQDALTNIVQAQKEKSGKNPAVVLTGHSLGAFIASMMAYRNNYLARVFSSPAIYSKEGINPERFGNVVNFIRERDFVDYSGYHAENRVYYPKQSYVNLWSNHDLKPFIEGPLSHYVKPVASILREKIISGFGVFLTDPNN